MKWFKKLSSKSDESQSKKSFLTEWFHRIVVEREDSSPLQIEANVVPKTEITASQQTLSNINIALIANESSGESSGIRNSDKGDGCINKYCCNVHDESNDDEITYHCDNQTIRNYKNSKMTFIESLLDAADNDGSVLNETSSRRPDNVRATDYVVDKHGSENLRRVSLNRRVFTPTSKTKLADANVSTVNYQLMSNLEKQLDESKFNLLRCEIYNHEWQKLQQMFGNEERKYEDFRDDGKNTPMSDDTRTIKEFYNLDSKGCILMHFQSIVIETGSSVESYSDDCVSFVSWLIVKGKEVQEKDKVKTSWIKKVMNFFRQLSK